MESGPFIHQSQRCSIRKRYSNGLKKRRCKGEGHNHKPEVQLSFLPFIGEKSIKTPEQSPSVPRRNSNTANIPIPVTGLKRGSSARDINTLQSQSIASSKAHNGSAHEETKSVPEAICDDFNGATDDTHRSVDDFSLISRVNSALSFESGLSLPSIGDRSYDKEEKEEEIISLRMKQLIWELHTAVRDGDIESAEKLLIEPGAEVNAIFYGESLLWTALMHRHDEMARFLIDNGADTRFSCCQVDITNEDQMGEKSRKDKKTKRAKLLIPTSKRKGDDSSSAPVAPPVADVYLLSCRELAYEREMFDIVNLIDYKHGCMPRWLPVPNHKPRLLPEILPRESLNNCDSSQVNLMTIPDVLAHRRSSLSKYIAAGRKQKLHHSKDILSKPFSPEQPAHRQTPSHSPHNQTEQESPKEPLRQSMTSLGRRQTSSTSADLELRHPESVNITFKDTKNFYHETSFSFAEHQRRSSLSVRSGVRERLRPLVLSSSPLNHDLTGWQSSSDYSVHYQRDLQKMDLTNICNRTPSAKTLKSVKVRGVRSLSAHSLQ